ncbi:amiloride-sensitive amine oxidase [copper-containing] isoform X2 [Lingula anatina]|nr:amiloride-sensitive amine oxidase [copper-containing] isoform X2 [Lingula anatina]|eukprot:XP_013394064.1 amiloride-sensitive amine oxidase [copper-containing] isoform X2 [Lingula anatina]
MEIHEGTKPKSKFWKLNRLQGWKLATLIAVIISLGLMLVILVTSSGNDSPSPTSPDTDSYSELKKCSKSDSITLQNEDPPTVFDSLTEMEMVAVRDYLLYQTGLLLKPIEKATVDSSYIYQMGLSLPNKADVLNHIDGNSQKPERRAKVVLARGDLNPPQMQEWIVFPLPKPTSHVLYKNPSYQRDPIPLSAKMVDKVEDKVLKEILRREMQKAEHVLKGSYGVGYHDCLGTEGCLTFFDIKPAGFASGERKSWWWAMRDFEGFYLFPVGLQVRTNHEGTNTSAWTLDRVFYNNTLFYSVEEWIAAYDNGIHRYIDPVPNKRERQYATYNRRGPLPLDPPLQGPRVYEPQGRRYNISGSKVKYLEWDFHIHNQGSSGIRVYDVRFRNERIAYEISLQEAAVMYGGWDPLMSTANYMDASWNLAAEAFELVPGVDCPENAVYFDTWSYFNTHGPKRMKNSYCVFEHNTGIPLRRHHGYNYHDGRYTYYGGMVDYVLVVRFAATVWNYDYIFDYIFHQNGVVECRASATGYVQATHFNTEDARYGHKIAPRVLAGIHTHLFNYKVDVDVLGTANRFYTYDIETESRSDLPWYQGYQKDQPRFTKNLKQTEWQAAIQYKFENPKYYVFRSNQTNAYGTPRGFRFQLNGMAKQVVPPRTGAEPGLSWSRYQIAITKRKDEEDSSTSLYSQCDPVNPVVNFESYVQDDENIVDEDLVAWVTLGKHHIPHSEDAPSTATTGNQLTFLLLPYNYFDEDASLASIDGVVIRPKSGYQGATVDSNGRNGYMTCAPLQLNLTSYGDINS